MAIKVVELHHHGIRIGPSAAEVKQAFAFYHESRKKNADALADLSLANFVEMRDKTASRAFLAGKRMEKILLRLFPAWFVPLYTMVTFTRIPYAEAVAKAKRQLRFVWAGAAAVVVLVLLLVLL